MGKSLYSEKIYLANDQEAIQYFQEQRRKNLIAREAHRLQYQEIIKNYNRYLLVLRDFMKSLGLNTEIENTIALAWLIKHGYISVDKEFTGTEEKDEILGRYGLSIIEGKGVCRNYSEMAYDEMRLLNYYSKQLYCYWPNLSLPKSATVKKANHVINLIEHDGVIYGIDLYNGCALFHFTEPLTLERITLKTGKKIRYKPYYEYILGESTEQQIGAHLLDFEKSSKMKTISAIEYEDEIYPDTISFMNNHKNICEDFHRETQDMKEKLVLSLYK